MDPVERYSSRPGYQHHYRADQPLHSVCRVDPGPACAYTESGADPNACPAAGGDAYLYSHPATAGPYTHPHTGASSGSQALPMGLGRGRHGGGGNNSRCGRLLGQETGKKQRIEETKRAPFGSSVFSLVIVQ